MLLSVTCFEPTFEHLLKHVGARHCAAIDDGTMLHVASQANRFYPTDPFTSTDPNPNYNSRDPVTGKPSVEIEITMSRQ